MMAVSDLQTSRAGDSAGHDLLEVSMGPHHPSTHGVFRMNVVLDGETVVKLSPVFGYLHRNHEKIAEKNSYLASIPYTDRLDYICSMTNNWAYVLSVEKLTGLAVPERAEYIRVIVGELTRLFNHACLAGFLLQDMGALGTPLMYAFREREKILDLFESLSGARMMCNYMRFGGCRCDLPDGWLEQAAKTVANFDSFLDHFEALLTGNEIIRARSDGVGVLPAALAINAGVTGPGLRASGVNYDIRKVDKYGIYSRFDFRVPLGERGDVFDRYMVRILEMRESLMGELGFYLISDGSATPYRFRIRPPSLINLTVLEDMCLGHTIADVVIILGSIDIVLGEVDR